MGSVWGAVMAEVFKSPDDVEWSIGERVVVWDEREFRTATIVGFVDGSWNPKDDAAVAAYFKLSDGWWVRHHLLVKTPS